MQTVPLCPLPQTHLVVCLQPQALRSKSADISWAPPEVSWKGCRFQRRMPDWPPISPCQIWSDPRCRSGSAASLARDGTACRPMRWNCIHRCCEASTVAPQTPEESEGDHCPEGKLEDAASALAQQEACLRSDCACSCSWQTRNKKGNTSP
jgi:hypothetical protein